MMKTKQFSIATLAVLLAVGTLGAQPPVRDQTKTKEPQLNQNQSTKNRGDTGDSVQGKSGDVAVTKDQAFAKFLAISNSEQVKLARFASEKATNADVKALVATLEKSHQERLDRLKDFSAASAKNKDAANTVSTNANNNSSSIDFLQIHSEMSEQCLKDSEEMLGKKSGNDFDTCFVGMQVAKHMMMHSCLTVLQRHTSGELQGFIKEDLAMNDEHMQASIGLMETLSDKVAARTAKNPKE
jgi:uncharacterized protein (DUF305 family)